MCIGVYAATNVCDTYAVNGQNGKTCIMRVIVSRTTLRSDEAKNFRREKNNKKKSVSGQVIFEIVVEIKVEKTNMTTRRKKTNLINNEKNE